MVTADDNWQRGFDLAMRFTETFPGIKIGDNEPIHWLAMEIATLMAAARNGAPQGRGAMADQPIKQAIAAELLRQEGKDLVVGIWPEQRAAVIEGRVDLDALARAVAALCPAQP